MQTPVMCDAVNYYFITQWGENGQQGDKFMCRVGENTYMQRVTLMHMEVKTYTLRASGAYSVQICPFIKCHLYRSLDSSAHYINTIMFR